LKTKIAIAVSLLPILAMALAYGQSGENAAGLNIPFKFKVGKKEMPAGKYQIVKPQGQASNLLLRSTDTGKSTYVQIIERLAQLHPAEKHKAAVVFDTVGDEKYLSEFWPGGSEDGYLLGVTKQEEKHDVVEEK
jgi:hypothetical protein